MAGECIGADAVAYFGTAGTNPSTLIADIREIRDSSSGWTKADGSVRGISNEVSLPARRQVGYEIDILNRTTNAQLVTLRAAYYSRTPLAFKLLDSLGGHGEYGDFYIFLMTPIGADQTLSGEELIKLQIAPAGQLTPV